MTNLEFVLRLAIGLGCGIAIGLERQWHQRMAGLRTNGLVAAAACLFVLLSVDMHEAFTLRGLHSEDLDGGDRVAVRASLVTHGADQAQLEAAVSRLSIEPGVTAVTWEMVDGAGGESDDHPSSSPRWLRLPRRVRSSGWFSR